MIWVQVRIMKTRQTISHEDLIAEVAHQLQLFQPTVKLVKRRIEYCIDNEYMERDPETPGRYQYIA